MNSDMNADFLDKTIGRNSKNTRYHGKNATNKTTKIAKDLTKTKQKT